MSFFCWEESEDGGRYCGEFTTSFEVADARRAHVSSGVTRLRPVMNTALTTVLVMIPLVTDPFYSAMAVMIMC